MSFSFHDFDAEIADYVRKSVHRDAPVLDVGAGAGKMRGLLPDLTKLDALEIHQPTVDEHRLSDRYRRVFCADLRTRITMATGGGPWDFFIFGDVLEHLSVKDAQRVMAHLDSSYKDHLVVVPYKLKQEPVFGNEANRHLQADLTHELMRDRYPSLRLLVRNDRLGVYVGGPQSHKLPDTNELDEPQSEAFEFDTEKLAAVRLAIATPTYGGQVTTAYLGSAWKTQRRMAEVGVACELLLCDNASVEQARNRLVATFLAREHTHLLFIDSDQGWNPDYVLRLLAHDRDVVGVASRKKGVRAGWAVNFLDHSRVECDRGVLSVGGTGTGFLMIRRQVFLKMMAAHPELKINVDPVVESDAKVRELTFFLFQRSLGDDGGEWGEDLTFCKRWRDLGGEIWVDPVPDLIHVGSHEYRGALTSLIQGKEAT